MATMITCLCRHNGKFAGCSRQVCFLDSNGGNLVKERKNQLRRRWGLSLGRLLLLLVVLSSKYEVAAFHPITNNNPRCGPHESSSCRRRRRLESSSLSSSFSHPRNGNGHSSTTAGHPPFSSTRRLFSTSWRTTTAASETTTTTAAAAKTEPVVFLPEIFKDQTLPTWMMPTTTATTTTSIDASVVATPSPASLTARSQSRRFSVSPTVLRKTSAVLATVLLILVLAVTIAQGQELVVAVTTTETNTLSNDSSSSWWSTIASVGYNVLDAALPLTVTDFFCCLVGESAAAVASAWATAATLSLVHADRGPCKAAAAPREDMTAMIYNNNNNNSHAVPSSNSNKDGVPDPSYSLSPLGDFPWSATASLSSLGHQHENVDCWTTWIIHELVSDLIKWLAYAALAVTAISIPSTTTAILTTSDVASLPPTPTQAAGWGILAGLLSRLTAEGLVWSWSNPKNENQPSTTASLWWDPWNTERLLLTFAPEAVYGAVLFVVYEAVQEPVAQWLTNLFPALAG